MKIVLGQISPVIGDFTGNLASMQATLREFPDADLVIFPELAVTGYPPRDLLLNRDFRHKAAGALEELQAWSDVPAFVVGSIAARAAEHGRDLYNSAFLIARGRIVAVQHKVLLPTYDVFDEDRYFQPGPQPQVIDFGGRRIALSICEDLWQGPSDLPPRHGSSPLSGLVGQRTDLLVNISASPFSADKQATRERLLRHWAAALGCPAVLVNQVGGNDELVFDGGSLAVATDGHLLGRARAFAEDALLVDTQGGVARTEPYPAAGGERLHAALTLGIRDYARRCGFYRAVLGLSGGIDSAVTAALAVDALGAEAVVGLAMPSAVSSSHSIEDANDLGNRLGIEVHVLRLNDLVAEAGRTLGPIYQPGTGGVADENVQARLRGLLLMAYSNYTGALLLTTGNKSELAVGYCTIYGDMCGGLAVISDVYKTEVYELARWINRDREMIPGRSLHKAPSAELRSGQFD
ncbi:MAG: NAD(+) synthase, partial [Verrucomicrobia bacterium RIFCSPLOWO2_12_FULL_64_8]